MLRKKVAKRQKEGDGMRLSNDTQHRRVRPGRTIWMRFVYRADRDRPSPGKGDRFIGHGVSHGERRAVA